MKKQKLVMIGNGMAGVRTLEELLKVAPDLYDITVFGAEPHPNYNRILLSPVLAGEQTLDEIVLNSFEWYAENGITLHAGKKVTEVDRVKRVVKASDGTEAAYDRLLICTGSNPFILPIPGKEPGGRDRLPRHCRHECHDRGGHQIQARCRHRRRLAGPGSRQRPDAARHDGQRGACAAHADGAPARHRGRRLAAKVAGSARSELPDGCANPGAGGWRRWSRQSHQVQRRYRRCLPTSSSWPWAFAPTPSWRRACACMWTAASWSPTPCKP